MKESFVQKKSAKSVRKLSSSIEFGPEVQRKKVKCSPWFYEWDDRSFMMVPVSEGSPLLGISDREIINVDGERFVAQRPMQFDTYIRGWFRDVTKKTSYMLLAVKS